MIIRWRAGSRGRKRAWIVKKKRRMKIQMRSPTWFFSPSLSLASGGSVPVRVIGGFEIEGFGG
jgi:hypothetical protein